ncbi:MAG: hypothetical protein JNK84_18295 [Phreatobacter sp.]|uniref:hypothetical protein n=1 Tax=Phreatobacter sp. TaxID=1966341 RepID=UPI001A5E8D11|nr:hypothetical protein [Phreatobacter sp.]MBL8571026.1 hypothetical protein [Phreatobacter sp.]
MSRHSFTRHSFTCQSLSRQSLSRRLIAFSSTRIARLAAMAAGAVALNLFIAMPASATSFCNMKRTSDGFAALRAAPDANARILVRMRHTDEVMLGLGERGPWREVTHWRGQTRHEDGGFGRGRRGWVHHSLLGECG